jgi:hypothetical protein
MPFSKLRSTNGVPSPGYSDKTPKNIGLSGKTITQNPRPTLHEKPATCTRKIRDLSKTPASWALNHLAPYLIELATDENTLFALEPTNRIVPTTMTRITANVTAYSAMFCPSSASHALVEFRPYAHLLKCQKLIAKISGVGGSERLEGSTWAKWLELTPKVHRTLCFSWKFVKQG